jgi:glycosyltransferase involved in cell wall biosynthesis
MKTAIVCDWLVTFGGSERFLSELIECFPEADLYAVIDFLPPEHRHLLKGKSVKTTFIQRLPFAKKCYRSYLPWMPLAIEQIDLSSYDLVISSSHAIAKGVITGPDQLHISYVHSPMRYAWDMQHQYLKESGLDTGLKGWLAKRLLHKLRIWDQRTANGVDYFVANSEFIARRIWKTYRREAEVIYPPINLSAFKPGNKKENFYLAASRLVPYKKMDLIVESFAAMPDKKLIVIGDGPDKDKIHAKAAPNIQILGYQSTDVLVDYLQRAKALVFAAEEDFGLIPLEAQACGTPVIAFGKGGALETVRDLSDAKPTGLFFQEQTREAIIEAVNRFETSTAQLTRENCIENAARFSSEKFKNSFMNFVKSKFS